MSKPVFLVAATITIFGAGALLAGCEGEVRDCPCTCTDGAVGDQSPVRDGTPRLEQSVGPTDGGVMDGASPPDAAAGTQAAIVAQAFAAPNLQSCTPPDEGDIIAPVQPFPPDPVPASPLTVGSGGPTAL